MHVWSQVLHISTWNDLQHAAGIGNLYTGAQLSSYALLTRPVLSTQRMRCLGHQQQSAPQCRALCRGYAGQRSCRFQGLLVLGLPRTVCMGNSRPGTYIPLLNLQLVPAGKQLLHRTGMRGACCRKSCRHHVTSQLQRSREEQLLSALHCCAAVHQLGPIPGHIASAIRHQQWQCQA